MRKETVVAGAVFRMQDLLTKLGTFTFELLLGSEP